MYCSKCGAQNEDGSRFCQGCGSALAPMQAPPPMAAPANAPVYVPKQRKPYRAEFALGLTSSIIGSVVFFVLAVLGIMELTGELYLDTYADGVVTVSAVFCLASVILGYVGSVQINQGNLNGGVPLMISAGLGFIAMFISLPGLATLYYWPLMLSGAITALARKSHLQKTGEYPL